MSYSEVIAADIRLRVLQALHQDADYAQNEHIISAVLQSFGHSVAADYLRTELHWLADQGFVELSTVGDICVVRLTLRGADIAQGRSYVPGVRRPRPGE